MSIVQSQYLTATTAAELTTAAGIRGYIAYAVDTGLFYCNNGTAWVPIGANIGPIVQGQTTLTGNASIAITSMYRTFLCDATSGGFTVTLTDTTIPGNRLTFKKMNASNSVVVNATIMDSGSGYVLGGQYSAVTVESTATAGTWIIVDKI